MKKNSLWLAIAVAIGLAGCSGGNNPAPVSGETAQLETDRGGSGNTSGDNGDDVLGPEKATLTFRARFPGKDAQAAVIDDNTQHILVRIYSSVHGDWEAVFADASSPWSAWDFYECYAGSDFYFYDDNYNDGYDDENCGGEYVAELSLSPDDPSDSIDLFPGKYRIVAWQHDSGDESTYYHNALGASTSLVDLDSGTHGVALNMLRGTWDFVNQNDQPTPLALQLMNRSDLFDVDPATEGVQPVDWDPATADSTETAAQALGIDQGELAGLHILSRGELEALMDGSGEWYSDYDRGVDQATVFRSLNADETEDVLFTEIFTEEPNGGTELFADVFGGRLFQSYDAETGNDASVRFGELDASRWTGAADEEGGKEIATGLFTWTDMAGEDSDDINANTSVRVEDGQRIYEMGGADWEYGYMWDDVYFDGAVQTLYVVDAGRGQEAFTQPATETDLTTLPPAKVEDGSTISGTLIEYAFQGESSVTGEEPPSFDGPAPASKGGKRATSGKHLQAAIQRALVLDGAARSAGLKARAASAYGENCTTLSIEGTWSFATYGYVGGQWVPGKVNVTYDSGNPEACGGASSCYHANTDLDGDNVAEVIEQVYYNYTYADLDGDGEVEEYEALSPVHHDAGVAEACVHPFTLKGGQLSADFLANIDVVVQ